MKWLACICAATLSCSGAKTSADRLRDTVMAFHHHLLSGDYVHASSMVAPEAFEEFAALHDPAVNVLRIEDFEILMVKMNPDTGEAIVLVAADTRRDSSITIKQLRFKQLWREKEGTWVLCREEVIQSGKLSPSESSFPAK